MGKTLDITGEKKNQELLEQKAERDSLTDLYNKAKMRKLVEKHIRQADDTEGAFIIIDIDDFKTINDTCGHLYGDEVLIKIANTILISAGMEDYAGRIGGDEFCVFCRGKNVGQHAVETAERISRMADQIQLSGRRVTLSMGISRYPEDASSYEELYQKADQALYRVKRSGKNAFSVYDKNYNYVDYTSERKGTDRETGFWQELEKYYKGRQWTETESEILSTMTRMMESYLNHEEYAGNVREREKDTEKPEPVIAGTETPESFSAKLEQILPWQDGQYAEVFLGIRDYDEISAKMSEEVKNSLLYHLGTHIQKHLKGQEMVCHVKKDEFLLLLDNHVEAASEKIGHIMIMFEAMIGDKYPDVSINLYSGIYYLESRGYRPEEIFRIGKTLKNKAKRYCTLENSIYENRKSAGNIIDKEAGILNRGNLTRLKGFMNRAA